MCGSSCPKWSYLYPFTCAIPAHVPFQDGDESGHPRMSAFISVLKRDMCVFGTRRAGACALRERLRSPCVPIAHNQALHGVPIAHMRSGCEPDALLLATKSPPCSSLDARTLRRVRFSAGVLPRIKKQVDTAIYLLVPFGGAAENRTPVHESPLIGISRLSRWFSLGRVARSDTLAAP